MSARTLGRSAAGRASRRVWLIVGGCTLLLVALAAAWRYTPLSDLITARQLTIWAKAVRGTPWAPVVFVLAYVPASFLMLPRQVLTLFGVVAFGAWQGFAYAVAGVMLCALVAYYVGHAVPRATIDRLARGKMTRVKKALRRHGVLAVCTLRLLPTAPYVVESMACGALRVRLWEYLVGTFLGMAPGALALTAFGHQLSAALDESGTANYWIAGGVVVLCAAAILIARRVLSK